MNPSNAAVSSTWITVCAETELLNNIGVAALVNQQQIALFRLSGGTRIYAIDNHDPFSGANVISRGIVGDLDGVPVVASPIYKQHFRLEDGQCVEDDSVVLATWPTRISDQGLIEIGFTG